MELTIDNIKNILKDKNKDGSAETLIGEIAFQNRDALKSIADSANGVTRSNTKWRRCEYIFISLRSEEKVSLEVCLKGWKALAQSHADQTLILEGTFSNWTIYNYNSEVIGHNDELELLIKKLSEDRKHCGKKVLSTSLEEFIKQHHYYLSSFRTKPFLLLAGISGTGKSRIVREFAFKSCPKELQDKDGTTPGNYCMVEVKPNWHDSTELLGYWSNLQEKYIFTKFVKFLVKAKMYPNVPFFVCLDEMNLAPVEQYFAEFLSVVETRKNVNGEIKSGVLVDKEYFKKFASIPNTKNVATGEAAYNLKNDKDIYKGLYGLVDNNCQGIDEETGVKTTLLTEGLTLPENVFIVGTVNMDDTTHQFSRKVIDRAMTIEMNGGALMDIFKDEEDLAYSETPLTMDSLRSKYVTAKEVIKKCNAVAVDEQISNYIQGKVDKGLPQRLQAINTVLAGTPFTVSYRVMNELTIYLAVLLDKAEEEGKDVNFDTFMPYVETAIDKILLMKILPRVEGDDEMFRISENERRINELSSQVNDEDGMSHEFTKLDWLKQIAPQHTEGNKEEYMAVDKLSEMIDRLNRQSFTRFWP